MKTILGYLHFQVDCSQIDPSIIYFLEPSKFPFDLFIIHLKVCKIGPDLLFFTLAKA